MNKGGFFAIGLVISLASLLMPGSWGCGGGDDSGGGGGECLEAEGCGEAVETVTLTGQVAVSAADAALVLSPSQASLKASLRPGFKTQADTALSGATVALVKMLADGTEETVDIGTVTTDTSGNYTIEDVPVATGGTGEATDFYYEVRVTSGDLTVLAPAAPEADTTVNVSPETHLAAKMLTDVQAVEGDLLPRPETIENLREMTADEVGEDLAGKVNLPPLAEDDAVVIVATAIGSDNGNSEMGLRIFESEKEALGLDTAGSGADSSEVGSYLETVGRLGCNFNSDFNLPETAREAMATSFINDLTVTASEIVTAYNVNNGGDPDAVEASAVSEFDETLSDIDTAIGDGEPIGSDDQVALFVRRELDADTFAATTELAVDQAMAFAQELLPNPCQPGAFDIVGFVSDLTGSDAVSAPSVVDRQIYNDAMGGTCAGTGHLTAEIQVYAAGGATVNGVTLTRDGSTKSLTRESSNGPFSRWRRNVQDGNADFSTAFDCVTLPSDPEYTISVDLEGATDLSETVTVNHRSVPEASISFVDDEGNETPLGNNSVTPTDSPRPIFKWSPAPGTPDSSVIANPPEGSEIKFTFELSHVITQEALGSWFGAGNVNEGPLASCGMGGSDQRLMDRNYFIADSDCDPAACLAILQATPTITFNTNNNQQVTKNTSEIQESDIACRTNVATFLVDENDRYLGVGAGNFRFYCVDSNSDGDCGN